jgi:putative FmdB family regulatory protein
MYPYRCRECGHVTETIRHPDRRDELLACEACGHAAERISALPQPAIFRFKPGYMNSVGSWCDTEAEYLNKVGKAKGEIAERYHQGDNKPIDK